MSHARNMLINQTLLELGVRPSMKGYTYLAYAVREVSKDTTKLDRIINGLYAEIAAEYDTTAGCVERCIRHGIQAGFTTAPLSVIYKVFKNTLPVDGSAPTAKQYIATVADYLNTIINEET